jgi:hypothetical protein
MLVRVQEWAALQGPATSSSTCKGSASKVWCGHDDYAKQAAALQFQLVQRAARAVCLAHTPTCSRSSPLTAACAEHLRMGSPREKGPAENCHQQLYSKV